MTIKRLIILLLLLILSTSVHAQRFNQKKMNDTIRYETWEVSLLAQYQTSWLGLGLRHRVELDRALEPGIPLFFEQTQILGDHRTGGSQ
jgi:hypothetical protein